MILRSNAGLCGVLSFDRANGHGCLSVCRKQLRRWRGRYRSIPSSGGREAGTDACTGFVGTNLIFRRFAEPSTWAMMLLGFAGLGYAAWRGGRKTGVSIIEA